MATEESNSRVVTVLLSCIPGFEKICISECDEILSSSAHKEQRGRITVELPLNEIHKLVRLRSVHHYWVVCDVLEDFLKDYDTKDGTEVAAFVESIPSNIKWAGSLAAWKHYKFHEEVIASRSQHVRLLELAASKSAGLHTESQEDTKKSNNMRVNYAVHSKRNYHTQLDPFVDLEKSNDVKFRVTCNRTGEHQFTSMEIAKWFGSGVNEKFGWIVNLTEYDIEVVLFVLDQKLTICLQLTSEGQDKRNLTHLGPTVLRPTISHCLLRCADVKLGDIICDPMCGSGSLCVESVTGLPYNFHFGGDNYPDAARRTYENFALLEKVIGDQTDRSEFGLPFSVASWDVCHLPLRDGSVDVFVSDMPFGKKLGSKQHNWGLYRSALHEMARVGVLETCRAVVITQHHQAMTNALSACSNLWKRKETININMGGLKVIVFVLKRTQTVAKACEEAGRIKVGVKRKKRNNKHKTERTVDTTNGAETKN